MKTLLAEALLYDSKDLGLSQPSQAPTKVGFHNCNQPSIAFSTPTIKGITVGTTISTVDS